VTYRIERFLCGTADSTFPMSEIADTESGMHDLLTRLLQKGQGKILSQHQVLPRFFSIPQGFLEKP